MKNRISRPLGRFFYWPILIALVALWSAGSAMAATPAKTTVQDTVYRADGSVAAGTLLISWPAFTTANGDAVAAGSMNVKIGANGAVNIALVPNTGSTPASSYKVTLRSSDGVVSEEYWTVPATATATIGAIRSKVAPAIVAQQFVGRDYVDSKLAQLQTLPPDALVGSGRYSDPTWLTSMSATKLTGTLPDAVAPATMARTNGANTWSGTQSDNALHSFNAGQTTTGTLAFPTTSGAFSKGSSFLFGGIDPATEYAHGQGTSSGQDALSVGSAVGSTVATYQTNTLGVYSTSNGSTTNVVGGYFSSRSLAANSHLWSINPIFMDGGFAGNTGAAIEADCNISNVNTGGACLQISGGFSGTLSTFPAIQVANPLSGGKWSAGIASNDGATQTGMNLGAQNVAANSYSQTVNLTYRDSGNSANVVYMQASPAGDFLVNSASGRFVRNNAGAGFLGGVFASSTANTASVGQIRLASSDAIAWRNAANTGEVFIGKNANDQITMANPQLTAATIAQPANGTVALTITRATDTAASGYFVNFTNAAMGGLWQIDVNGVLQAGSVPAARISGAVGTASALAANGSNCGTNQFAQGVDAGGNAEGCAQPAASNLSNGTTGSGAVVLASSPALTSPNIGAATGNSLDLGKATIDSNGKLTKYNNVAVVGSGVGPIYGSVSLTAQGAAISATNLYTATAGLYRVCYDVQVTRAATSSSSVGVTIGWNNGGTQTKSSTAVATNALNAEDGNCFVVNSTAANITYATTYSSSGGTSMQYALRVTAEQLQ